MEVIFVLMPVSLILVGLFVVLFVWSVKNGQFEDLTTPALRILFDDDEVQKPKSEKSAEGGENDGKDATENETVDSK